MIQNTGAACRKRTYNFSTQFKTVSQALKKMQESVPPPVLMNVAVQVEPEGPATVDETNMTQQVDASTSTCFSDFEDSLIMEDCASLLDLLLTRRGIPPAKRRGCQEFIRNTVDAVENSHKANVYNLVFGVAQAISKNKSNNDKQVLPFNRMPYQMLEYQLKFVNGGCQSFVSKSVC